MGSVFKSLLLSALVISKLARCSRSPDQREYKVKENHPIPEQWSTIDLAPAHQTIRLQIGLRCYGDDKIEQRLRETSDPRHHHYGRHLTASEIRRLSGPSNESRNLVEDWLRDEGVEQLEYSPARDWITISIPIGVANRLLRTSFSIYRHSDDSYDQLVRTPQWSLPSYLHDHIEVIQPTNSFFLPPKSRYNDLQKRESIRDSKDATKTYEQLKAEDLMKKPHIQVPEAEKIPGHPTVEQACNRFAMSPLCLRTLYGTLDYVPQAIDRNSMAIVNFLNIQTNRSDIDIFLKRFRPEAEEAAQTFRIELVNNAIDDQTPNPKMKPEGNLDAQAILGIGYPTPLISYNVAGRPPFKADDFTTKNTNEPYLEWLQSVLAQDDLPPVISLSYADDEQTVPYSYAKRVCHGFAQLGARGITVLVGSGDEGVGRNGTCYSNDGTRRPTFIPKFPASCPYVTAVGSTRYFSPELAGFDARNDFVTGGGFSNYFPRPEYQQGHIQTYLNDHLKTTHAGLYNPSGRGIPDISAAGYHYPVVFNGTTHLIDGTSASAPAVAGIIALLNDALIAAGRPTLGFLNPWLYAQSDIFTDVTLGRNRGCDTSGFPAAEGWDAATGIGTPWFPKLKERALAARFRLQRPWYMGPIGVV